MAVLSDKNIYTGKTNPFDEITSGAKTFLDIADKIIIKGKELANISIGKINSNPKKTVSNIREYQTEIGKLTQTTIELTEVEKQRKLLQDQLTSAEDKNVKAKLRYNDAVRTQKKELSQLIKWQKAEKQSIDKLNAANAILRNRVRGISSATVEGRKKIALYNKAIDRNTVKVKQLSDAQTRQLKNVGNYGSALKGVGSALGVFTSGALLAATAMRKIVSVTKEAIEVNREFEKTFANVLTLLDESQKKEFKDVLAVGAVDVMANYGLEIGDVNKALFDVISNGIEAGDAIEFLNKSAVLATAGNAELSDVVKGATKVYTVYKDEVKDVDEIMNAFFAAQVDGATDVNLLANNIGKIAGTAKKAGIPINELFGTFAGLTKSLDGTEESATALVNIINSLIKASPAAQKEFKKFGIETGITAVKQNGLLETILQVVKATEDNEDAIVKLIPNIRAFKGIATLTEDSIDDLKGTIEKLNDQELSATLLQEAFNEQMGTGQKQADLLKGSWERLLITIGGGESIFKKIGTAIRTDLNKEITSLTKQLEIFKVTWNRVFGDLSKDEYIQALIDIENRFAGVTAEINNTNEALEGNEAITKTQMALIIKYNKELEKNLKFTKENYDLVKKYYDEIPPKEEEEIETLKSLNEELSKLKKERQEINTSNIDAIIAKDAEIEKTKDQIKAIEELIFWRKQEEQSAVKIKGKKVTFEKLDTDIDLSSYEDDARKSLENSIKIEEERNRIIEDLKHKHYDSLFSMFTNYKNKKAAADLKLSNDEVNAQIESNAQKEAAVRELAETLINIYNQLLERRLQQIESEIQADNQKISEQEQAVNRELQLSQAGAANQLETEKEKLASLQIQREKDLEERKKIQKQQQTVDTLTQISSLATAIANIISGFSDIPVVGVVLGLAAAAAAVAGFATYKSDAESAVSAEEGGTFISKGAYIEKGNRHSNGGNRYNALETERDEMHGILSRDTTRKHGDFYQYITDGLNNGLSPDELEMYKYSLSSLDHNSININNDYSKLSNEVAKINQLLRTQKTPFINKHGHFQLYGINGMPIKTEI